MDFKEVERSILTGYRKSLYRPFTKAIDDYKLLKDNDKVCVCISGGKDSFLLAKLMQEYEKHGKVSIKCEYLCMDPGYSKENLNIIKSNAKSLGIKLKVVKSNIFECVKKDGRKSPCYVCAKMRRGFLYDNAKKLGCNKIALGHHFDDAIETTMLSMLYNGRFNTMLPKLKSEHFEGMELIRPLYLIREKDIQNFMNRWNIKYSSCSCPLKSDDSKRLEVKSIINKLKETNEFVDYNIFKSSENVEIDNIRGIYKDGEKHSYLEKYENKE